LVGIVNVSAPDELDHGEPAEVIRNSLVLCVRDDLKPRQPSQPDFD
jgi:hypothetical protein